MTTASIPTDGYVQVNGLRLHYLDWQRPGAPTIVMVHGLRSNATTWLPVIAPLSDRYRIVAVDLRGRGGSAWDPNADYSRAAYVSDLEGTVAQLQLDRFILMGHSLGGAITIAFTAANPGLVRAAVLEDPAMSRPASIPAPSPAPTGLARIPQEVEDAPLSFESWSAVEAYVHALRPGLAGEAFEAQLALWFRRQPDGSAIWAFDLDGIRRASRVARANPPPDLWPALGSIECPMFMLRGGVSDVVSLELAETMHAANPRLSSVDIAGAGHEVHRDNLPDFNRELAGFLSRIDVASPSATR